MPPPPLGDEVFRLQEKVDAERTARDASITSVREEFGDITKTSEKVRALHLLRDTWDTGRVRKHRPPGGQAPPVNWGRWSVHPATDIASQPPSQFGVAIGGFGEG